MSYPKAIIIKRLRNELKECREYLGPDFDIELDDVQLPFTIRMRMSNVVGYEAADKIITDHEFTVTITDEYGESKPEVRWKSKIFHPNIMMPEDGGLVCMKLLNEWSYGTHMLSFLKSIEALIAQPNIASAFGTDSCMLAVDYFTNNKIKIGASVAE